MIQSLAATLSQQRSARPHPIVFAGLLVAFVGLGACVSATFVPTVSSSYPARPPDCELEIFSSAPPDRAYLEIGVVEGEGSAWNSDLEDVLPALREEACLAGGEGMILQRGDTFTEGDDGIRVQRITATVIRWR